MAHPHSRWKQLEALSEAELEVAYMASLDRRRAVGDPYITPVIRLKQLEAFRHHRAKGKSRQERIYFVASSEDVARRKELRAVKRVSLDA